MMPVKIRCAHFSNVSDRLGLEQFLSMQLGWREPWLSADGLLPRQYHNTYQSPIPGEANTKPGFSLYTAPEPVDKRLGALAVVPYSRVMSSA